MDEAARMSGSIHRDAPCSSEEVEAAQAPTIISLNDRWNALMTAAQNGNDRAYERLMGEVSHWLSKYFPRKLPPAPTEHATPAALPETGRAALRERVVTYGA